MAGRKEFLVRSPFFGGLEDAALERLMARLVDRAVPSGTQVFRAGEQGRAMYIVEEGELVALQQASPTTRPVRLMRFSPGDFFGETTLIEMHPRPFSVVAQRDSRLLEITNMDLLRLYEEDVNSYVMVLQNINRELCRRLRRAGNRLTDMADFVDEEVTLIKR